MPRLLIALAVVVVALLAAGLTLAKAAAEQTLTLTATVQPGEGYPVGRYVYLPFEVPAGTRRVAVKVTKDDPDPRIGAGLFDEKGAGYQSGGFRGIYGEERGEFFVAADSASQAFTPGVIKPGTWTVAVPVFRTGVRPFTVKAEVTLTEGEQPAATGPGPELGVLDEKPGWYRGDLHVHSNESSDAFASQRAFEPRMYGDKSREVGLDWVSLTDHNVTSQNRTLRSDHEKSGTLVLGGEEMTNWFHGHATVTGLEPGDHIDWRQRPVNRPLGPNEARIQRFLEEVRKRDVYTSIAHPFGAILAWQFFVDAKVDPAGALPEGIEVWTGPFQPDDQASVDQWDELLQEGQKIFANGGSDVHGFDRGDGFALAQPTTITYADQLSKPGVVGALKRGRSFVTRLPDGVELYLSATGPDGQRQPVGGTIYGGATDTAKLSVLVRRGQGGRLVVLRDGQEVQSTPITAEAQTVAFDQPVGARGGYVRVELRRDPAVSPAGQPISSRLDMEALTNPIFLAPGPIPPGTQPQDAPPPAQPGPRRPVTMTPPVCGTGASGGTEQGNGSGTGSQTGNSTNSSSCPGNGPVPVAGQESPGNSSPPPAGQPLLPPATACLSRSLLRRAAARPRGRGLAFDLELSAGARARVDVVRVARGRRIGSRRVVRFTDRTGDFAWSGRRAGDGDYVVRFSVGGRPDLTRSIALRRTRGRFRTAPAFDRNQPCGAIESFRATQPVFGGARGRSLALAYRLGTGGGRARVELLRGRRVVRRFSERAAAQGVTVRRSISARGLRRGTYRVRITVRQGEPVTVRTITVRRR